MQKIGEDTVTQDWWKLTDPMQEPIRDRKEGEWWASMEEIGHYAKAGFYEKNTQRLTYATQVESILMKKLVIPSDIMNAGHMYKLSVFHKAGKLYLYCEYGETSPSPSAESKEKVFDTVVSRITFDDRLFHWEGMAEVFHAD
jgi:L-rhamnose mutarotase